MNQSINANQEMKIGGSADRSDTIFYANGQKWIDGHVTECFSRSIPAGKWKIRGPGDDFNIEGQGRCDMSPFDFCTGMFPTSYLSCIVAATNIGLERKNLKPCIWGEISRFFGIAILM